jgi:aminoglycoside/choline kinase family phosphotransferase
MEAQQRIEELYAERFGSPPAGVERLTGDGSARLYWRLRSPDRDPVLGAFGPEDEENEAFLAFSDTFRELGLPVPEIYARDLASRVWLLEDLGDSTLFDLILEARREGQEALPEEVVALYRRVLEHLPAFQVEGGKAIDYGLAYPRAAFDRQSILWDLNYFKYHFLKLAHIPFNEAKLERDFGRLARFLLKTDTSHFLYRDFQSRNVMVREGEPWFIDYQGGRRGALQYDVASLLYDAKADLGEPLRAELLTHYLDALSQHIDVDPGRFEKHYNGYALIRILQAMGAYGYRGFYERKPRFLQSVPAAARNIALLLERGLPTRIPEIERVLERIVRRWGRETPATESDERLTVQLGSFRYAGGYPEDTTGHGGGFVFDCRALPNPGREPEYRRLNGLDPEVIRFFEARPETEEFWSRVRDLATAQVEVYVRRHFYALSIQFGCTGGQHRSVYLAERLASHLAEVQPDIKIEVTHRERADWPRRRDRE